jgi:hypothetical protein
MLPPLDGNTKVEMKRKPLRPSSPRLTFILKLSIKMSEELSDVLVHLDSRKMLPNATATTHAKLADHVNITIL